jgi:hypothetical protein
LAEDEKKGLVDKLKKEIARLEFEEALLKKRDDRLKWEEEMLQMEEGIKVRGKFLIDKTPASMFAGDADRQPPAQADGPAVKPKAQEAPAQGEDAPAEAPTQSADSELDSGLTYLLLETRPERSIAVFVGEMKKGSKGLYITRSNPNQVKKKFDLGDAKVCWLTGVRAGEGIVSVSGLQELSILVSNFIDENKKSIILLDGVEYLISNNDFSIVLRLLQQIRDKVSTSDSKMLIPLNPNALESRQLTLLERECHTIH